MQFYHLIYCFFQINIYFSLKLKIFTYSTPMKIESKFHASLKIPKKFESHHHLSCYLSSLFSMTPDFSNNLGHENNVWALLILFDFCVFINCNIQIDILTNQDKVPISVVSPVFQFLRLLNCFLFHHNYSFKALIKINFILYFLKIFNKKTIKSTCLISKPKISKNPFEWCFPSGQEPLFLQCCSMPISIRGLLEFYSILFHVRNAEIHFHDRFFLIS